MIGTDDQSAHHRAMSAPFAARFASFTIPAIQDSGRRDAVRTMDVASGDMSDRLLTPDDCPPSTDLTTPPTPCVGR